MSDSLQVDENVAVPPEPEADEIDKLFTLAKDKLKRKLSSIETQQVKLGHATSQMRIAFAMFQEDANRAEAVTMKLLAQQPPYSREDQTEVAVQFAVAAASRTRLERIVAAQFVTIENSVFETELKRLYSQDHGRTILGAIGVHPVTEETRDIELNKNFAVDYQRCLREIVKCAIEASRNQGPTAEFVVDFGRVLPETQIMLGKLVKLDWYTDYHPCRGGKQFEDHCHGCRGCRGTEAERTRAICCRCELALNLGEKKLVNSPEELAQELGIRYFW